MARLKKAKFPRYKRRHSHGTQYSTTAGDFGSSSSQILAGPPKRLVLLLRRF